MPTGVSVVIPSFRGAAAATATIASLDAQTLTPDRFEVVLVVNGPGAADLSPFEAMRSAFPRLTVRVLATSTAGASLAWNLGVQAARMEWLTFLDDDDAVSPTFLAALVDLAEPGVVPLAQIHDVYPDGRVDRESALNQRITARAGTRSGVAALPQALGFNASKLIPTGWAKGSAYDHDIANGQDVAYFGDIGLRHDITFSVAAAESDAAYLRTVSDTSMSRQQPSFDFSIDQRLDVIARLDQSRRGSRRARRPAVDHLVRSQVHMMNRYLVGRPHRRREVLAAVASRRLGWFPYPELNRDLATSLVVVTDGEAAGRTTRRRFERIVADAQDRPVDVVAFGRARPRRGWVEDIWLDDEAAKSEGRLIRVTGPLDEALENVVGRLGPGPAHAVLIGLGADRATRLLTHAIAARYPTMRLEERHRRLGMVRRVDR